MTRFSICNEFSVVKETFLKKRAGVKPLQNLHISIASVRRFL